MIRVRERIWFLLLPVLGVIALLWLATLNNAVTHAYQLPNAIPPAPPKWKRVAWPFGLREAEAKNLQRLDGLLSDIEQARAKVHVPRLVLPGPLEAEKKQRLTVQEYEAELLRVLRLMQRPLRGRQTVPRAGESEE